MLLIYGKCIMDLQKEKEELVSDVRNQENVAINPDDVTPHN